MTATTIDATEIELKRRDIQKTLWLHAQVVGRVPSPDMRARLSERLRASGATDDEIEAAYQSREECFIAVFQSMNYHRHISIVDGRLEIAGRDSETHQDRIARWNVAADGELTLAATTWKKFNQQMGAYKQ